MHDETILQKVKNLDNIFGIKQKIGDFNFLLLFEGLFGVFLMVELVILIIW